jgi:hypothetical protein
LGSGVHDGIGNYDLAYQYQQGYTVDGQYVFGQSYVYSDVNAFNLGLSYDQVWSYLIPPGDSATERFDFASSGLGPSSMYAFFDGTPTFVSINAPVVSPVPEPETYAMLLAGLGLNWVYWASKERPQRLI